MTPRLVAACALLLLATPVALAQPLRLEGSGGSRELRCEGRDVWVTGERHRLSLTGPCGRVEVMGTGHAVTLDSARQLVVQGEDNTVRAGGTLGDVLVEGRRHRVAATLRVEDPVPGQQPKPAQVDVNGEDAVLELVLTGRTHLAVNGARQRVLWSAAPGVPAPEGDTSGVGNVVERRPQP